MKDVFYENELSALPPFSSWHSGKKTNKLQILEAYLEPYKRSMMELFGEISWWYLSVNYFHKQVPSLITIGLIQNDIIFHKINKHKHEKWWTRIMAVSKNIGPHWG